jgi:hypothetical protein
MNGCGRVRLAVHADLAFGHGFQEGCLRLGGVRLISSPSSKLVKTGPGDHLAGARVEHRCAGEIGGQHVRGELTLVNPRPGWRRSATGSA